MAKSVAQIAAPRGVVVDREERSPIVAPFGLKLTIHDRTRIEWIATAPIAHEGKPNQYTIDFEIDVPDHLWRRHKLWQSFRARSRLQSPDSRTYPFQMRSILDEIRHEALRTSRAFSRLERRLFLDHGEDDAVKAHLRGLLREVTNSRATLRRAADEADDRKQALTALLITHHQRKLRRRRQQQVEIPSQVHVDTHEAPVLEDEI